MADTAMPEAAEDVVTEALPEPDERDPDAPPPLDPQALQRISDLALKADQTAFTNEQLAVMRVLRWDLRRLTPAHVAYFIYFCQVHGVDPFAGEAMPFVTEDGDVVPILTIAGFRRQAERTGEYRGTGRFEFLDGRGAEGEEGLDGGIWRRDWIPSTMGRPVACRVDVHRAGWPVPTEGMVYTEEVEVWETRVLEGKGGTKTVVRERTVRWEIGKNGVGNLMAMLQKCAEAAALRRAFPRVLDGFYVAEEMERLRKERREAARAEATAAGEAKRAAAYAAAHPERAEDRPTRDPEVVEGVVVERESTEPIRLGDVMEQVSRLRQAAQAAPVEEAPAAPPEPVAVEEEPPPAEEDDAPAEDVPPTPLTPEERVEALQAELSMQAEVLRVEVADLTARWEKTYGTAEDPLPYLHWDDIMLLRAVRANRRQVAAKLARDPARYTEASAYARVGDDEVKPLAELLGLV